MPTQQDDELRELLREYLRDTGGERAQVKTMINQVLAAVSDLREHVDTEIQGVRQEVRGVVARVFLLEEDRRKRPSMVPRRDAKLEESYTKTNTGTFRLDEFELHDLHKEAATWRWLKATANKIAIPVIAAVVMAGLAIIYAAVWHPRIAQPIPPGTMRHHEEPVGPGGE